MSASFLSAMNTRANDVKQKKTGQRKTKTKTYYATTVIEQGDYFGSENTWDFDGRMTLKGRPYKEDLIKHLTRLFEDVEEAFEEHYERLEDDYDEPEDERDDDEEILPLNFHGMSPKEFARFLVEHRDEAEELYDTTWSIAVYHEVTDPENWEHPC